MSTEPNPDRIEPGPSPFHYTPDGYIFKGTDPALLAVLERIAVALERVQEGLDKVTHHHPASGSDWIRTQDMSR